MCAAEVIETEIEDEVKRRLDRFRHYDFTDLAAALESYENLPTGARLTSESIMYEFPMITDLVKEIEASIQEGRIIVLTGAHHIGVSTLMGYFEGKNIVRCRAEFLRVDDDRLDLIRETDSETNLLIIDGVTTNSEVIDSLREFLSDERRRNCKLLLEVNIVYFDEFRDNFRGYEFGEFILSVVPNEQMVDYVGFTLGIDREDEMVELIAYLSTGYILYANALMNYIATALKSSNDDNVLNSFMSSLIRAKESFGAVTAELDRQRELVSKDLKPYIPNPPLKRVNMFGVKLKFLLPT